MKKDFFVIILGSDDNAYGDARLVYEKYSIKPLLLCSRALRATKHSSIFDIKVIPDLDSRDVFAKALKEELLKKSEEYEKIIVIPCSDYYLYMLVDYYDTFDGLIANRFISRELMERVESKEAFYSLCEEFGIPYPKTYVIRENEREGGLLRSGINFPLIVKPENSNATDYLNINFEGKKKVYFFRDNDEYEKIAKSLSELGYKGALIAQEYIEGEDSCMRTINCYSDLSGKVVAASLGQPVLEEYSPKTLGNYAAIISRYDEEIYRMVTEFLNKIGYVGFSNFDIKIDKNTGKPYFFEINPRLGRSSFFVHAAGLNMLSLLIDEVVYAKTYPCVYTDKTALWSVVPRIIIRRYVSDKKIRAEALSLWNQGKYERTLLWRKDMNIRRRITMKRHSAGYVKAYHKYYQKRT